MSVVWGAISISDTLITASHFKNIRSLNDKMEKLSDDLQNTQLINLIKLSVI